MESLREKLWGKTKPLREKLATVATGALSVASGRAPIYAAAKGISNLLGGEQTDEQKKAEEERLNKAEIQSMKDMHARMGYNSDDAGNRTTPMEGMTPEKLRELEMNGGGKTRKATVLDKAGFAIDKAMHKTGEFADKLIHGETITYEAPKQEEKPQIINKAQAEEPKGFDRELFRTGIVHNETRGAKDPYTAVGPTKDLGKYQASPATLKGWAKAWLGKEYTPDEFLKDPSAQEKFFEEFTKVAERLNLTHEQAAVAWHRGWGELGTGDKATRDKRFLDRLNGMMEEDISKKYLESFNDATSSMNETGAAFQDRLPTTLPPLDDIRDEDWEDPTPEELAMEKVQFDRERGVMISAYRPKLTEIFSNALDKVKSKIPGANTKLEVAMREEVAKNYPLTPEAKKILNEVDINFVDKDSLLGGKAGAVHQPLRGEKTAKVFNKIWETPVLDKVTQKIPPRIYRLLMGEQIKLDSSTAETAFHEGLHAVFARKDINTRQFLKDWDAAMTQSSTAEVYGPAHDLMGFIDEKVSGGIYEGNDQRSTVNEMYAYLGSIAGIYGLDGIPGSLRKYYTDVLMPTEKVKPPTQLATPLPSRPSPLK